MIMAHLVVDCPTQLISGIQAGLSPIVRQAWILIVQSLVLRLGSSLVSIVHEGVALVRLALRGLRRGIRIGIAQLVLVLVAVLLLVEQHLGLLLHGEDWLLRLVFCTRHGTRMRYGMHHCLLE